MNPHRRGDIAPVQGISCAEGNITLRKAYITEKAPALCFFLIKMITRNKSNRAGRTNSFGCSSFSFCERLREFE